VRGEERKEVCSVRGTRGGLGRLRKRGGWGGGEGGWGEGGWGGGGGWRARESGGRGGEGESEGGRQGVAWGWM